MGEPWGLPSSILRFVRLIFETPKGESDLGYIILIIIIAPVIVLLSTFFLGRPRTTRLTLIFLLSLLIMFGGFIAATYLLGLIFGTFF